MSAPVFTPPVRLFFSLLFFAQQPVNISLVCQQLPHLVAGLAVVPIGFFLLLQQLGILSLQALDGGQLLYAQLVKGLLCRLMQ